MEIRQADPPSLLIASDRWGTTLDIDPIGFFVRCAFFDHPQAGGGAVLRATFKLRLPQAAELWPQIAFAHECRRWDGALAVGRQAASN
jgi:hypothetical protein